MLANTLLHLGNKEAKRGRIQIGVSQPSTPIVSWKCYFWINRMLSQGFFVNLPTILLITEKTTKKDEYGSL